MIHQRLRDGGAKARGGRRGAGPLLSISLACLFASPASGQLSDVRPPYSFNDIIEASKNIPPPAPYIEVTGPRSPLKSVTDHVLRIGSRDIRYKATVAETFIPGPANKEADASLVTIAYTRDGLTPAERAGRPVLFIFNGGPGASSTPLQGAMSPVIHDDKSGRYTDNPTSPLDVADLVFFDPVGSGFSRALPGKSPEQFWSTRADAQSARYLVQHWLKSNGREASPRYLVGESYGTSRAGHIAGIGADLDLDGIVLVSATGMPSGHDMPFVLSFPTFAAAAAYHGKGRYAGQEAQKVFADSVAFARGPYLSALMEGDELSASQRDAIAREVAERLGLPKAFILEKNLRLGNYDFMLNLLKDEGNRIGQLDARAKGALKDFADRKPPYDDPSMGLGKGTANTPQKPATNAVHDQFLKEKLGYRTDEGYIGLNLGMLFAFKHSVDLGYRPVDTISELMRKQPKLRLMLVGGIYDITTPFYAATYNLAHANVPRERTSVIGFAAGHEVYSDDNQIIFNDAIRTFVTPEIAR